MQNKRTKVISANRCRKALASFSMRNVVVHQLNRLEKTSRPSVDACKDWDLTVTKNGIVQSKEDTYYETFS